MSFILIGGIALSVILILFLAAGYLKAPTDMALVITGLKKRFLIGKAGFRIPLLERVDRLKLELIPIDVQTQEAIPTNDFINIFVDAAVNIQISSEKDLIELAAQHFLNKDSKYVAAIAQQVLEGNMREIVGQMKLRDMVIDRQQFADKVRLNAEPDLKAMGLRLISFNVQNFRDNDKIIENLGIDNISRIRKDAAISRAVAEKEILIAQATADKEANDAAVASQLEINRKKNDLAIEIARLKVDADTKKAEADAAYAIQEQGQRKTIEVATAEANLAKLSKETEVQTAQVTLTEKTLDATVRKTAEADRFKVQQEADADLYRRRKDSEAKAYEAQQQLEAEKARAEAVRIAMEQEAAGIEAKGKAEAEAIKAKALAEAEGISAKADAQAKMADAAKLEMIIARMPEIVEAAAKPLQNVQNITQFGDGNNSKLVGDIMQTVNKVGAGLGLNLSDILTGLAGKLTGPTDSDKPASK